MAQQALSIMLFTTLVVCLFVYLLAFTVQMDEMKLPELSINRLTCFDFFKFFLKFKDIHSVETNGYHVNLILFSCLLILKKWH